MTRTRSIISRLYLAERRGRRNNFDEVDIICGFPPRTERIIRARIYRGSARGWLTMTHNKSFAEASQKGGPRLVTGVI